MTKTKIEWCDFTWNPVWGCLNDCPYCYARKAAKRFGKQVCGRDDFRPVWVEANYQKDFPKKPSRIFINSMSDVMWWWDVWILKALVRIYENPEHTFLMLTKQPNQYLRFEEMMPDNLICGTTLESDENKKRLHSINELQYSETRKFASIEPMFGPIDPESLIDLSWIIIGAETGNRKEKVTPQIEWIAPIYNMCREKKIPLFMKDSLAPIWGPDLIREFPS